MKKLFSYIVWILLLFVSAAAQNSITGGPVNFVSYSPTQLGVNALTEPASGTTALSNIIDTRGVKQATLLATCTQGNWTINVTVYAEDGTTTWNAGSNAATAIGAGIQNILYIGSESTSNVAGGTNGNLVRFPQRAIAFSFTNASATPGTCTARLFVAY